MKIMFDTGKAMMAAFEEQRWIDIWIYWWVLDQGLLEEAGFFNHTGI